LDAARDNDAYWRKYRREEESRKGNVMSKDAIKPLRLVQAQAEDLPFKDESFDIVVCVYLYHELPQEIRSKVSAEMARVLKQNGLLVFTDSIQRGDRPMLDKGLKQFENMNEPFYANYCEDYLPDHFLKEGLTPLAKSVRSTTKSLSFLKA
jgi:ubiquinone/menaquinone biosynthesis C-methylase UbiE